MVDELARRVETLAAVAEETWGVGLGVEVEEESAVYHCQAAMEDIEAILEFIFMLDREGKKMRKEEVREGERRKEEERERERGREGERRGEEREGKEREGGKKNVI